MKPYGSRRRDNLTCRYGCCTTGRTCRKYVRPGYRTATVRLSRANRGRERLAVRNLRILDYTPDDLE